MKARALDATGPASAFVLLDALRVPLYANAEAMRILFHRREQALAGDLASRLGEALWTALPAGEIPAEGTAASFLSGRRRYTCRLFRLAPLSAGAREPAYLLMMDRSLPALEEESPVAERYSLTQRETELLGYLMTGLTNKEIGERMHISPNTVKAFLKLMMTKMGVSTRAAVVGRAFEGRAQPMARAAGR